MKSKILELIKTNPDWQKILEDKNIKIKIDIDNLAIFNYGIDVDPFDPYVKEARGIIIDLDNYSVVCWPFTRFYNSHEAAAQEDVENFDWSNCRVENKLDGSICKLFYRRYKGAMAIDLGIDGYWSWATNSCINAFDAPIMGSKKSFGEVIESAVNFKDIPFDELDKNCTYIFELVSPLTQVVISYPYTKLYHIGTRNNITGEEYKLNIGIDWPKVYDLHSLKDCINFVDHINDGLEHVEWEGFVAVDKDWHRLKIKSPAYLEAHYIFGNGNCSKERLLKLLDDYDLAKLTNLNSSMLVQLKYYDYRLTELEYIVSQYISYVRGLYEEYNHDRKAVANQIKNDRLAPFGFAAIGNDKTAHNLLLDTRRKVIADLLPDYESRDMWRM